MTRGRVLAGLVLAVVLVAAARSYFRSDRRLIEAQLADLSAAASSSGRESPVARMAGAARVGRFFTEDAMILAGDSASVIGGRDAVMAVAAQMRAASGFTVAVEDAQVSVTDPANATGTVTVTLSGVEPGGGLMDAREVSLTFRKVDGTWLIARAETVRTLQRPE